MIVPAVALFFHAAICSYDWRTAAIGGWMTGTIKSAGSLIWVLNMYPLDWLQINSALVQVSVIIFYWFGAALALGLGMMLAGVVIKILYSKNDFLLLLAPVVLIIAEIFGSLLFSLYALGPGGYLNINFTFGYMGYAMTGFPWVIEIARLGGVYAMSFVAALAGFLLYLFVFQRSKHGLLSVTLGVCALVVSLMVVSPTLDDKWTQNSDKAKIKVIAVQTYVSADIIATESGRKMRGQVVQEAVDAALNLSPDAVVLPEMSDFKGAFESSGEALSYLNNKGESILVDSGKVIDSDGKKYLRATVFDPANNRFYTIDKNYLVPQGETVAYHTSLMLRSLGQGDFLKRFLEHRSFSSGVQDMNLDIPPELPGVLFCFSSIAPNEVARVVRDQNPNWIAHPVSHSWFNGSALLSKQLDQVLRVQAVASGVPIIKAGNMSNSGAYYPDGSISYGTLVETSDYWRLYEYEI